MQPPSLLSLTVDAALLHIAHITDLSAIPEPILFDLFLRSPSCLLQRGGIPRVEALLQRGGFPRGGIPKPDSSSVRRPLSLSLFAVLPSTSLFRIRSSPPDVDISSIPLHAELVSMEGF
ncbi:hypothetical protein Taro_041551 [Colocasia esculenta]|uniref:Uncharacterized protein n=1 Tax=Colocasia esculenta TaxID=4460 RepID=A0A843WEN4_COLES|nr:hypothetical protein [Colocasia esculenta]